MSLFLSVFLLRTKYTMCVCVFFFYLRTKTTGYLWMRWYICFSHAFEFIVFILYIGPVQPNQNRFHFFFLTWQWHFNSNKSLLPLCLIKLIYANVRDNAHGNMVYRLKSLGCLVSDHHQQKPTIKLSDLCRCIILFKWAQRFALRTCGEHEFIRKTFHFVHYLKNPYKFTRKYAAHNCKLKPTKT